MSKLDGTFPEKLGQVLCWHICIGVDGDVPCADVYTGIWWSVKVIRKDLSDAAMLRFCYRRKVKLTEKSINKSSRAGSRGDVELCVGRVGWDGCRGRM